MRILIGPVEVSGIAAGLKLGFDRLGVEAELVLSQPHRFGYSAPPAPGAIAWTWTALGAAMVRARKSLRVPLWLLWKAWSFVVLVWASARFDSFIFLFGNTLTNSGFETWLLKRLGKRVIVIFCGSDSRPPYVDGWSVGDPERVDPAALARLAARRKKSIRRLERHGCLCVNAPWTGQFHGRPYVSWFAMGIPQMPQGGASDPDARAGRPVRALHSPSHPRAKGTEQIVAAVERLRSEGLDIELSLMTGVPNERVRAEIAGADFVIDQLYSDTPMAGFVAEAGSYGRPAVVCGYSASDRFGEIVRAEVPPSLFVHPDGLADAIARMASDAQFRAALARDAEDFVRRQWSVDSVAGRYLGLLTGPPPPEWMIDPDDVIYVHGAGISERDARRCVRALVSALGAGALQLDDKPALRDAFLRLAQGSEEPRR